MFGLSLTKRLIAPLKANIEARLRRHAKLKETQSESAPPPPQEGKVSFFDAIVLKLQAFFRLETDNPMIARLVRRVLVFSLAFMLITPFVPLYGITEGYNYTDGEGLDFMTLTEQNTDMALNDVMTEDGFLLKPALNTVAGDRSTANEIFAYQRR